MGIIANFKKRLINLWGAASTKEEPEAKVTVDEPEDDKDAIRKKLEQDFQTELDSIGITQNDETLIFLVNSHIQVTSIKYYRNFGFIDGQIGSRDFQILLSATSHAERITSLIKAKVSGRIEALKRSISDQNDILLNQDKVCEENADFLSEIQEEERQDDKSFNKFQAWMYIFFGLLMIMSDVAVSLNLVNFFGIGNRADPGIGLWNKIKDGELLFFSLGIAFCTVYVKILYDDYINTKMGAAFILKKKLIKKGVSEKALAIEKYFKGVVKFIILIGLLIFLYSLAQFRAFHTKNDILDVHNNSSTNSEEIIGTPVIDKTTIAIEKQKALDQDRYLLYSFIGLSLMVPLISGISLSVGFRIFQRRRMLLKTKNIYLDAELKRQEIHGEIKDLASREAEFSTFYKEWEDSESKIKNMATFFANNYNQGYREGYRSYFGNDLYVVIEEYRNEFINKAFSKALTKI